jgi:hypothetical protein
MSRVRSERPPQSLGTHSQRLRQASEKLRKERRCPGQAMRDVLRIQLAGRAEGSLHASRCRLLRSSSVPQAQGRRHLGAGAGSTQQTLQIVLGLVRPDEERTPRMPAHHAHRSSRRSASARRSFPHLGGEPLSGRRAYGGLWFGSFLTPISYRRNRRQHNAVPTYPPRRSSTTSRGLNAATATSRTRAHSAKSAPTRGPSDSVARHGQAGSGLREVVV